MKESYPNAELFVTPDYWDDACKQLSKRDAVLKRLIKQHGTARLKSRGDAFSTLARSIIGQQISVKAADSVWAKFETTVGKVKPANVLKHDVAALRAAGLSLRKADYIRDLSERFTSGALRHAQWSDMPDDAVIAELIEVRGIGRWTAEMYLMFFLLRPNVFPLDDLGLLKGLSLNYGGGEPMSRSQARDVGELWAPWATVGTWYIWRSLENTTVESKPQ